MSAYDDSQLAAQFAALAPEPLEGRWDDVLREAIGARDDGTRLTRSTASQGRRRYLVALVAAALIVVVGTASAIGGVREFILDRGFIGLPPEGATPSTPESGELILHYFGRSASHRKGLFVAPLVQVWVYADGRMLWFEESSGSSKPAPEGANELVTGYLEQRLTAEGIELLRSEVAELFDRSRDLLETVPADRHPLSGPFGSLAIFTRGLADGIPEGSVDLREGDRLVGLHWMPIGGHAPRFEGTMATPEQLSALRRIDALLTDPGSVLPRSAWAVRKTRAYVPSHYATCFWASPPPRDESQLLSLLPTRAADLLRNRSWTRVEADIQVNSDNGPLGVGERSVEYCSKVTTDEARMVAEALSGLDPKPHLARLEYQLAEGANWWNGTNIWFEPYFPDGTYTCSVCG